MELSNQGDGGPKKFGNHCCSLSRTVIRVLALWCSGCCQIHIVYVSGPLSVFHLNNPYISCGASYVLLVYTFKYTCPLPSVACKHRRTLQVDRLKKRVNIGIFRTF
jgi:hypothetical protein